MMRKGLVILLATLLVSSCIKEASNAGESVTIGDPMPAFTVTMGDGSELDSRSLNGHPSLLVFFNTTCPDCRVTLPRVQRAYEEFAPRGVRFVAISRAQGADEVRSYWDASGFTIPWSAQEDRKVYQLFAQSVIPRVYVFDRRGTVTAMFGDNPCPQYEDLVSAIEQVL